MLVCSWHGSLTISLKNHGRAALSFMETAVQSGLLASIGSMVFASQVFAQSIGGDSLSIVRAKLDSVAVSDSLSGSPARIVKASKVDTATGYVPTKSPGIALLLSAVLPGAGQTYNESYWKVPIVVGFGVWLGSQWLSYNRQMRDWRTLYSASITADNPGGNSRYLQLREFYKDQRDTFSWYLFIWYMLTLVDSYVDASLYDFNVSPDLSMKVVPTTNLGVRLQIRF
jgi:hypothetical protein